MKTKIGLLLSGAVMVVGAMAAPAAFAAQPANPGGTQAVRAITYSPNRADTCSCVTGNNGDVWAYDNLVRRLDATPNGSTYTVVVTDLGTFHAQYEPNHTGGLDTPWPISANGSIVGTITYVVTSPNGAPKASNLPWQISSDTHTSDMVLKLFPSGASITGGGDYRYVYRAGHDTYTQSSVSPYITGDITGH